MNDLLYALRIMRKAPLFTAAVVLTIALAIGANITIFSIVNAVLLQPLPFRDPATLVQVAEKNDKLHLPIWGSSVLNFLDWRPEPQLPADRCAWLQQLHAHRHGGRRTIFRQPDQSRPDTGPRLERLLFSRIAVVHWQTLTFPEFP
jgi:hypothetical protein